MTNERGLFVEYFTTPIKSKSKKLTKIPLSNLGELEEEYTL
jgi:hypothetical protein